MVNYSLKPYNFVKSFNSNAERHILIIGGGITGLVHAYFLAKANQRVTIINSQSRWGGMIQSIQTEYGLVESAANGLLNSKITEELIQDLGIEITHHHKASKRRYIFSRGIPMQFPISIIQMFRGLIGVIFKDSYTKIDENMEEWCKEIFGIEFTKKIIEPALGGIYATPLQEMDPRMVLSFLNFREGKTLFQLMKEKPKKPKPNVRGLIGFKNGMQELIEALVARLKTYSHVEMNLNSPYNVFFKNRDATEFNEIRICTPIQEISDILSNVKIQRILIQGEKEEDLRRVINNHEINNFSIATITRFSQDSLLQKSGFGILFPRGENVVANGVLSNDSIFPGRTLKKNFHSETWIYSGDWLKNVNDKELLQIMETDRKKIRVKDDSTPNSFVKIWIDSFPVYNTNLYELNLTLDKLETHNNDYIPRLLFFGNYRRGIGLRSIIESAHSSI